MEVKKSVKIISYIIAVVMIVTLIGPAVSMESSVAYGAENETYRILEIQPTNNYQNYFDLWWGGGNWGSSSDWAGFLTKSLKKNGGKVTVTRMTSAEFNGKEEDLVSNYDLIYIGVKGSKDDLSFQDYRHMGDEKTISGAISNRGEKTQKSGEDITADKKAELLQYADAGYPILISDLAFSGKGNQKLRLDLQSNMYDLLNNELEVKKSNQSSEGDYKNVISCELYSYIDDGLLTKISKALTSKEQKCSLNITEQPKQAGYINETDINNRELKFKINISDGTKNSDNASYKVDLFIDLNSDGKYEASENMNQFMQIRKKDGSTVKEDKLKAGEEYILTRDLGDYVGIIYWKLQITKCEEDGEETAIKDEAIDYCKIQPKILVGGKEEIVKRDLKILQIMAEEGRGDGGMRENNVWLPTQKEVEYLEGKYKIQLERLGSNPTEQQMNALADVIAFNENKNKENEFFRLMSGAKPKIKATYLGVTIRFWLYTRNLNEFTIKMERMPVSAFEKAIAEKSIDVNNYDMLILGFADCYTDIDAPEALRAIDGFIKDGKTILFTHDTTSFVTEKPFTGKEQDWAYNINKYFRNMLGMDRYGYGDGSKEKLDKILKFNDVKEEDDREDFEKDYVWNSVWDGDLRDILNYTKRAHGFTDCLLDNMNGNSIEQKQTNTITAVNTGQITTYPYKIPTDTMDVATTHGQYYQLDLESNDIVPWYVLSGGGNGYYGTPNARGIIKKDVRNNYYIYNRRNITYSGAGHNGNLTNNEIKLFVNTMVGAYRAASTAVSINITNPDASRDKAGNISFYVSYLKASPKQPIAANIVMGADGKPAKRVYFTLQQNSVATNGKMTIKFGNISEIYDEKGKPVNQGEGIKENKQYYVDIPVSQLGNSEKFSLMADLRIEYKDDIGGSVTKNVTKDITFMRRTMFNLN